MAPSTYSTDVARPKRRLDFQRMNEIGLLVMIALLYLAFTLYANNFLTFRNQVSILRDAATFGIAAWGATLIIISGEIDISVGPMVAFLSVCFAFLLKSEELPIVLAFLMTALIGCALGAVPGILRAFFDVPSFIGTLGLWSALGGLALYLTDSVPVTIPPNDFLDWLGGELLGIPVSAIIMFVLFGLFAFISRKTAFGRSIFAIGGNASAAHLAGIKVRNIRVMLFVIAGFLAAITAILLTARNGVGDASVSRSGLEFSVISAVVVGGTALTGGRGSILGTLLGIFVISLIGNGLVLMGINSYLQPVVSGIIIVAAVLLNILASRYGARRNLKGA
ncbi:MAG: ABC transporter permease [Aquamicrobium sp.]|nr:ABC transporter permease [Aquamicrobium sp.]